MLYEVDILLSTYNGQKYLPMLLDSLLKQTYPRWRLVVRDDGSTDATMTILHQYRKKCNMIILEPDGENLGPCQSFSKLIQYSDAQWTMFCDQDDVWLPEKIERTLEKMRQTECQYSGPVLIHTDLIVVNENLETISPSFWKYQKLDPSKDKLSDLLVQNNVTGCTMMINRSLRNCLTSIPNEAIMHDWWISLVAATFGQTRFINQGNIMYRQHYQNHFGAKKYGLFPFFAKFYFKSARKDLLNKLFQQSIVFLDKYNNDLSKEQKKIFYTFGKLTGINRFKRLKFLRENKINKHGFLRDFIFKLIIFLL